MITLTEEGLAYAESHQESIVARVALMGEQSGWPDNHVEAAIRVCNETATKPPTIVIHDNGWNDPVEYTFPNEEQAKLGAAYLSTFTGPWGIKGSEEDALLNVLHAIDPKEWPDGSIEKLRSNEVLSAFCDELYDKSCEVDSIVDLIAWLTGRLPEILS